MKFFIKNANLSVSVSLTTLAFTGFWAPDYIQGPTKILYYCYAVFSFMFLLGIYILIQLVDMYLIWGDLQLMTGTAFVLFTNLAQLTKIFNLLLKRARIAAIIDDADEVLISQVGEEGKKIVKWCDRETTLFQLLYLGLTTITISGWAGSAEKNSLPLRAWYPYDTTKSPAYELTYCHQVGALFIAAYLNVAKDSLVSALIAQNRCRLQLLNMALRNIHEGLNIDGKSNALITPAQESIARARLRRCVKSHQAALHSAQELQECFTLPTFAQFAVSMVIICVTAFQLASQTKNLVRFISMTTYLMNMVFQVFIYCYQGNELREESIAVAANAYECLWFRCSIQFRRALLILMMRTRRPIVLKAGAFTALSLSSFMAIIKTSYSFFTLLQQVEESI